MALLNYNGVICTSDELLIPVGNRALRYGEGLIETMLWKNKKIRLFDRHAQRLQQSLALLGFPDLSKEQLQQAVHKMLLANQEPETGMVRVQCFRDDTEGPLQYMAEFIALSFVPGAWLEQGLTIGVGRKIIKSADHISHLKTTSRLPYIIATHEATSQQWDDILLLNQYRRIAESSISNIFAIRDGKINTPPLSEGCIAGVLRNYLLEQGEIAGMAFREHALDEQSLAEADELFLTNAIRGIQPVASYNGRTYSSAQTRLIFDHIGTL